MATLMPASSANVEAAYEDMFKEITRKLYGEETGNGLHTLGTPVAQVATTGPTAPEGERSFTNLQIDRSAAPTIEYEHNSGAIVATGNVNATSSSSSSSSAVSAITTAAAAAAAAVAANVRQQQQPEGANSVVVVPTTCGNNFIKTEDQLSTAFGLAALMQNGFATTSTILSTQALNKVVANATGQQQQQTINEQQQQARWTSNNNNNTSTAVTEQQQQQPTQIVQWTTNSGGKLQSYSTTQQQQQPSQSQQQNVIHTPKSKSKNRPEHGTTSVINSTEMLYASPTTTVLVAPSSSTPNSANTTPNTSAGSSSTSSNATTSSSGGSSRSKSKSSNQQQANNNSNNGGGGGVPVVKRYACTHCPYSTDRRDLYTRHENIHKDEKPFQCYACLKQFNRADHVKKHFLRMHREMQYDINKTRRHVPSSSSSSSSGGAIHHTGGRGNVTIPAAAGIHLDDAFLEAQRQPTSSSLSIAETIEAVATAADDPLPQLKQEKNDDGTLVTSNGVGVLVSVGSVASLSAASSNGVAGGGNIKPKREKRFTCCYCPWSGADKWGLKRHLNTHTKPFVCLLCEYKAARSERLATHVLKVHNKRACNKCSFLADTQEEYQAHVNEVHPNEVNRPSARHNNTSNNTNSNRNTNNNNNTQNTTTTSNVLRTIGNTLNANTNNNQLNTFQNSNNNFGVGNSTTTTNAIGNAGGGSVTIYTTTTTNDSNGGVTTNIIAGGGGSGGGGGGGGPLQEIIVNPSSMVGWRLSANGSLIPPHDLLTGSLPTAAVQKRGSERLFQYLEADGSDTEDYARLLKMDAISRNTASVAQDFHKAGGVHELKIPANHQLLFNNKLPSQWTTREAAALLHSLSNMHNNTNNSHNNNNQQQQQQVRSKYLNNNKRQRQHSVGDDENTPSSSASSVASHDGISPMKATTLALSDRQLKSAEQPLYNGNDQQRRAMQAFLGKNFDLQEAAMNELQLLAATTTTVSNLSNNNNKHNNNNSSSNKRKHSNNNNNSKHDQNIDEENQENQEQLILTSPAYNKTKTNNNTNHNNNNNQKRYNNNNNREHRQNASQQQQQRQNSSLANDNKENSQALPTATAGPLPLPLALSLSVPSAPIAAAVSTPSAAAGTFLTQMEYQNLNKIGTQFQNYVKDIINKYYAETPLMFPAMPTATTTPQQSQQPLYDELAAAKKTTNSCSSATELKRKRMLSETEEYIEYLKNKEDITLTITPKQPAARKVVPPPPALSPRRRRQEDLTFIKRASPKSTVPPSIGAYEVQVAPVKPRKSLTQIATLLPLLADAACQQQYLAAPLDFSKKAESTTKSAPAVIEPPTATSETTASNSASSTPAAATTEAELAAAFDKRSSRKQAQPKKIRTPPEVVIAMLRDKYLNLMVNHKLRCNICRNNSQQLVFHYHSKASLALHRLWKHGRVQQACKQCGSTFDRRHSLGVHMRRMHGKQVQLGGSS